MFSILIMKHDSKSQSITFLYEGIEINLYHSISRLTLFIPNEFMQSIIYLRFNSLCKKTQLFLRFQITTLVQKVLLWISGPFVIARH